MPKAPNERRTAPKRQKRPKVPASPAATTAESVPPPRRGRPSGKRSDPDYEQITAYVRRETYRDVKIALLLEGKGADVSELLEILLSDWLKLHS